MSLNGKRNKNVFHIQSTTIEEYHTKAKGDILSTTNTLIYLHKLLILSTDKEKAEFARNNKVFPQYLDICLSLQAETILDFLHFESRGPLLWESNF